MFSGILMYDLGNDPSLRQKGEQPERRCPCEWTCWPCSWWSSFAGLSCWRRAGLMVAFTAEQVRHLPDRPAAPQPMVGRLANLGRDAGPHAQ